VAHQPLGRDTDHALSRPLEPRGIRHLSCKSAGFRRTHAVLPSCSSALRRPGTALTRRSSPAGTPLTVYAMTP
jgi:hypothetical protein